MKVKALSAAALPSEVALLRPSESSSREIADVVASLIDQVRARGDAAVAEATARFDWEPSRKPTPT
jgi:histidinol dehydrogenase